MPPARLEPAATRSRVKHSRSHDIVLVSRFFKLPQERCDKVSWPSHHGQSSWLGDVKQQKKQNTNIPASTKIAASTKFAAGTKIPASTKFAASTNLLLAQKFLLAQNLLLAQKFLLAKNLLLAQKFLLAQKLLLAQKFLLARIFCASSKFCAGRNICVLFVLSQVNNYGHGETISSPNHTFLGQAWRSD